MPKPSPILASNSLAGATALITGGTAGIGAATAEALAVAGARVLVVGRDPARGAAVVDRIRGVAQHDRVEFLRADLSAQAEVRRLADEVLARCERLDILLNNAGAMFAEFGETADGIERTWALNHLAYFLLTDRLRNLLVRSAPARVVSVASEAHRSARGIDFDDPQLRRRYGMFRAYAQSKLANVLFARELARRLEGTGVTSNAVHPGFVLTSFFDAIGPAGRFMKLAARVVGSTVEAGARASIFAAGSPDAAGLNGRYIGGLKAVEPAKAARDDAAAARLWALSAEMTGVPLDPP